MAKNETNDDNLYDGLYGDEFEEDFAVPAVGNPTTTDSANDDGVAELLEPPEDVTSAPGAEEPQPIPTLDSKPNASDALPPKPASSSSAAALSYSAQVAEQFSTYRQTPSQERGRLDAARLAQFNQSNTASGSTSAGDARPVRPSEMKDEGCVSFSFPPLSIVLYVEGMCTVPVVASTTQY
ncbi:hypothetical protein BC834DRAFT_531844 [Gloeopeniophorella convolvens]|nr:hypothetical protein BC834DRAFT_531844 [Gloeopeniophorella convolvens]